MEEKKNVAFENAGVIVNAAANLWAQNPETCNKILKVASNEYSKAKEKPTEYIHEKREATGYACAGLGIIYAGLSLAEVVSKIFIK